MLFSLHRIIAVFSSALYKSLKRHTHGWDKQTPKLPHGFAIPQQVQRHYETFSQKTHQTFAAQRPEASQTMLKYYRSKQRLFNI